MEEDLDFTDEEIREELSKLGYYDIVPSRLQQFKRDLEKLVRYDRSFKDSSQNNSVSSQSFLSTSDGPAQNRAPLDEMTRPLTYTTQAAHKGYPQVTVGKENLYSDQEEENLVFIGQKPRGEAGGQGDGIPAGAKYVHSLDKEKVIIGQRKARGVSFTHGDGFSQKTRVIQIPGMDDTVSDTDSERRYIRRKTLRKATDGSKIIDESITESEVGSLGELEDRLREVRMADHLRYPGGSSRPASAPPAEPPYRLDPDDPRPASVILRTADHPHTRNLKKCDPVARYRQFRQSWSTNQIPGEKQHKQLRWNVREQMLCQDTMEFKRPQKKYVANSYVVPTEKKRSALRWQVRMDIAQGNMPLPAEDY